MKDIKKNFNTSVSMSRDYLLHACNENTNEQSDKLRSQSSNQPRRKKNYHRHYMKSIPLHKTIKNGICSNAQGHWWSAAKAMLMSHQGMQTQFAP